MTGDPPFNGIQNCIVEWPYPWPGQQQTWPSVPTYQPLQLPEQHTHYHFTPTEPHLSDEDVERIAKRVAELLRGEKP